MKSSSRRFEFISVGSLWVFKHAKPELIVRVFEIDKKSGVTYGLRQARAGHITATISGFIENYTPYTSKEDKKWQWPI